MNLNFWKYSTPVMLCKSPHPIFALIAQVGDVCKTSPVRLESKELTDTWRRSRMRGVEELYNREVCPERGLRDILNIDFETTFANRHRSGVYFLISSSLMSKTSSLLAGIPGRALLPYARCAGMFNLRSPPTCMPATPISQPLITSPTPSLKENGFPFLLAVELSALGNGA